MWFRNLNRLSSTFFSKDLTIKLTSSLRPKPELNEKLLFGAALSDHMLEIDWSEADGWSSPKINPYHSLSIDPASSVLHYGTECFEGLKAYKTTKGHLLLFRPEMNMLRFKKSAAAVGLPDFDATELLQCIKEFVKVEES